MENFFRESGVKWLWGRIKTLLSAKQDKLVSGTNIKTINGESILGGGDVVIVGGGTDKHGAAYPDGKTDKPYHKVASVSSAVNATLDTNISFYVSAYHNDTSCGILNISLRWTANSTNFKFNRIFWSLNVGIDVNNFVLGWTVVDGIVTCNLYVKRTSWTSYALKRLDEQAWGNPKDLWKCYNATYPNNCYATILDANTVVSVNETISNSVNSAITANNASTANKLTTARKIEITGSVVGSTTFDGSKNATINSKLDWGGKYAQATDPIEALALQGQMNVFSFIKPESVTVEYHNGDGVWLDYGLTNEDITNLFTPTIGKSQIYAGKESNLAANATTRIIIDFYQAEVYARIKEILIKFVKAPTSNDYYYTKFSVERYEDYMTDTWISSEDTRMYNIGYLSYSVNIFGGTNPAYGYEGTGGYARLKIEYYRKEATTRNTYLSSIVAISNEIINAPNPMSKTALPCTLDWKQNAKFPANVTATKHITQGGTNQQVVLGDGSLRPISELSPITDADADILLDNHIHNIDVYTNGNDVNISVIESSKNGNTWETEDNDITIPLATTTSAGVMSKEDKNKLDSLSTSAGRGMTISGTVNLTNGTFNTQNNSSLNSYTKVFGDMSVGEMRMYLVADSSGNLPSTSETAVTVPHDGILSPAQVYFGKSSAFGVSVGDICVLFKKSSLLNTCRIIPLNDVKPSNGDFPGADGLSTVWDKNRINKIDGIEWIANHVRDNYLPKSDRFPSRPDWLIHADICLDTGVYPTCDTVTLNLGWTNQYGTLVVHRTSTVDNGGYHTIEQTVYGRGADEGQIYKRIIFYKSSSTEYGDWKRIDLDNTYTKEEVDTKIGDINTILESIINN